MQLYLISRARFCLYSLANVLDLYGTCHRLCYGRHADVLQSTYSSRVLQLPCNVCNLPSCEQDGGADLRPCRTVPYGRRAARDGSGSFHRFVTIPGCPDISETRSTRSTPLSFNISIRLQSRRDLHMIPTSRDRAGIA